ncbi:N-glycosylase/DNA lyase [Candidatus Bathyarchaeota archaeon]|nr:N-glycosylase/DNA lyase [Candidatus Bathyarchaeota archaeon]MBS7613453.1 N-glycosylase/DNA lyase [Candidatus Bathyarchaeota archaeon]MBS7617035.1 N-glycosylase/DNA lyase [Candidatus Bathyarchaeota archaeon]
MSRVNELLEKINSLKNSHVKKLVDTRIEEFKQNGGKASREIFRELCFCILTANFNAERSIEIQRKIGDGFLTLPIPQLMEELKALGHRYPERRAQYIVEARRYADSLKDIISRFKDASLLREWLAKNIKGIGFKEASHFLRNIGYLDLAIVDFHIINILSKYGLIDRPKTMTRNRYLEIESILRKVANRLDITLAELDLFLWYLETGKVLK